MSDLGNRGWPNAIILGGDIDLDELLLNPVFCVFVLPFNVSGEVLFWGLRVQKKHPYES